MEQVCSSQDFLGDIIWRHTSELRICDQNIEQAEAVGPGGTLVKCERVVRVRENQVVVWLFACLLKWGH